MKSLQRQETKPGHCRTRKDRPGSSHDEKRQTRSIAGREETDQGHRRTKRDRTCSSHDEKRQNRVSAGAKEREFEKGRELKRRRGKKGRRENEEMRRERI